MGRGKSPAQVLFDATVKQAVAPVWKALRFRKSGTNFHRRHGDVVQVVNLQSSHGSEASEKRFYVNVGLAFDAVCELTGLEILEKPKEYECSDRGNRWRLENLIDDVPDRWSLRVDGDDTEAVAAALGDAMQRLATELDRIDSVQAYRDHRWFRDPDADQLSVQVLYLLGDFDGARQGLRGLCERFADRESLSRPEWWIESLGLKDLSPEDLA